MGQTFSLSKMMWSWAQTFSLSKMMWSWAQTFSLSKMMWSWAQTFSLSKFMWSWAQTFSFSKMMWSCMCFPHMSKNLNPAYNWWCNQIYTMGATSGAGTAYPSRAPEFTPSFQWGSCYSIFNFMRMFCRSLFVLQYFFFWPLFCLFFFDIQILITPLVFSSSSCKEHLNLDL